LISSEIIHAERLASTVKPDGIAKKEVPGLDKAEIEEGNVDHEQVCPYSAGKPWQHRLRVN